MLRLGEIEASMNMQQTSSATCPDELEDMVSTKLKTPEELEDFCAKIKNEKDFKKNLVCSSVITLSLSGCVSNR